MQNLNRRVVTLLALLLGLLLVIYVFASPYPGNGSRAEERSRCSSPATFNAIRSELFRRAALVRGADQAAFGRIGSYALLRVQSPTHRGGGDGGAIRCSGALAIDLPPGVAVAGGRRSLTGDISYTIQPSANGGADKVALSGADTIIRLLATMGKASDDGASQEPATAAEEPVEGERSPRVQTSGAATPPVQPVPPIARPAPPPVPRTEPPKPRAERRPPAQSPAGNPSAAASSTAPRKAPAPRTGSRPSFNCRYARTASEKAVCGDPNLAGLDRQMAGMFNRAVAAGTPAQRELLQRTRNRFLSYRERCGSPSCVADTYRSRMTEINDIMAGRWKVP